ncbi:hypothetical protein TSAR_007230 [Trichomalopsis sarcophagae]|uniref:Reverse transcriptase domain-containing protein n=1 Tax=Trichomalopsis sarcophagae TaxID=543379 RepID=A0A232EJN4_9HYME|nr:hypothetical protein TSAR_007230 [Trichomalopsis sarcophagae]
MLKTRKAAGVDEIPNEVWIHGGEDLVNRLICVLGKIWDGDDMPEEWKTGLIVPLFKKGDTNDTKNCRGISLLSTAYKLYMEVIRKRLEEEVNEKNILPEGQAVFRKGMSTLDNIYVLNYLAQRAKTRKKKLYSIFVDLNAAFDTVDRKILWETMKKLGISNYLIERIKGIYEETKVSIRMNEGNSKEFWTNMGLRQGCVLSQLFFCIYITDLEREFKERNIGGVKIGEIRIWSLAYADDIVMLTENREGLVDMCDSLKRLLRNRKLILSTEKTKVLVFNKGKNSKKEKWFWEDKVIEEVKSFKYLGFVFNRDGNYKEHIEELKKKGICAAKKTWGLGEKCCRGILRGELNCSII